MRRLAWHELRAPELRALAADNAMVIIPVGSTEQHGPHLPVQVDARLVAEVAQRAAGIVAEREPVVVMPTLWCGLAAHHMSFGATLTLDFPTFHAVLRCLCRSAAEHGFRRLVLLNGHGGNIQALDVIAGELKIELGLNVVTASYWTVTKVAEAFAQILEKQRNVRHAGEAETSMMMALEPDLVDSAAAATIAPITEGIRRDDGLYRWRAFDEMTDSGVIGFPAAASAEKGERLLAAAASGVAESLLEADIWP